MSDNMIVPEVLKDKNLTLTRGNVKRQEMRMYLTKEQRIDEICMNV
jgi:hypothetical protein